MSAEQAISADCKAYEEEGARFSVAQIEELSFSHFYEKEAALTEALDAYCRAGRFLFAALLVTDIISQTSMLLLCGAEAYLSRIDYPREGAHRWVLDGVVSRKKQLLPYLLDRLHGMENK